MRKATRILTAFAAICWLLAFHASDRRSPDSDNFAATGAVTISYLAG